MDGIYAIKIIYGWKLFVSKIKWEGDIVVRKLY